MFGSQYLLSGKRIYLLVLVLLLFISVVGVTFSVAGGGDFDIARREILLRRIGHELPL